MVGAVGRRDANGLGGGVFEALDVGPDGVEVGAQGGDVLLQGGKGRGDDGLDRGHEFLEFGVLGVARGIVRLGGRVDDGVEGGGLLGGEPCNRWGSTGGA